MVRTHPVFGPAGTRDGARRALLRRCALHLRIDMATLEGKTASSFIVSSALASAEKTLQEHESMQLNEQDAQRFFDALAKPVRFNKKLTEALAEHERRVHLKRVWKADSSSSR
jgi:uncharacterized protein (DUF1778 family)